MRFIPRQLLVHSAEVRTPLSEDSFGNITFSEPQKLSFIRIDDGKVLKRGGFENSDVSSALLIYDCRNSLPKNFIFSLGQRISFGGRCFSVSDISFYYEKKLLHHIEVTLEGCFSGGDSL